MTKGETKPVRLDDEVLRYIAVRRQAFETPNAVLRRLFGMKSKQSVNKKATK